VPNQNAAVERFKWSNRWTPKASAAARMKGMRRGLPEGNLDLNIARMNRDFLKAIVS
jgi:hypothetical protein